MKKEDSKTKYPFILQLCVLDSTNWKKPLHATRANSV